VVYRHPFTEENFPERLQFSADKTRCWSNLYIQNSSKYAQSLGQRVGFHGQWYIDLFGVPKSSPLKLVSSPRNGSTTSKLRRIFLQHSTQWARRSRKWANLEVRIQGMETHQRQMENIVNEIHAQQERMENVVMKSMHGRRRMHLEMLLTSRFSEKNCPQCEIVSSMTILGLRIERDSKKITQARLLPLRSYRSNQAIGSLPLISRNRNLDRPPHKCQNDWRITNW